MRSDFNDVIERLTGHKVVAFMSGNHIDPDMAAEIFVLDGEPEDVGARLSCRRSGSCVR
jgi:uncharacterized protein YbcI